MNFATVFDEHYRAKGLALIDSIKKWCEGDVFVLDASTNQDLILPDTSITHLWSVASPELILTKTDRSHVEFLWTLASWWTWYLMNSGHQEICYVDADTCFFNSPDTLWEEINNKEIAICPHRWTPHHKANLEGNGIYNVGLVYFKYSDRSFDCLSRWKDQCLAWCYDAHDGDKFGDQKYLDTWERDYGAYPIQHLGIDLAPWNQEQYDYCLENGILFVDDGKRCDPLTLYHFSEFGTYRRGKRVWTNYTLHPMISRYVYPYYERELSKWKSG